MVKPEDRAEQQRAFLAARLEQAAGVDRKLLEPPYHIYGLDMLYFLCRFDPGDLRRVVPSQLSVGRSSWGLIAAYFAPSGWEIAPFGAFYAGAEIQGFDGPDGFPCMYQHAAFYGDNAFEVFRRTYNSEVRNGAVQFTGGADGIVATGTYERRPMVRMGGQPRGATFTAKEGVNRYAAPHPVGGVGVFSVPFTCPFVELDNPYMELTDDGLRAGFIQPLEITWAIWSHGASCTLGVPRQIAEVPDRVDSTLQGAELVELFGRLGRPALVITADDHVERMNAPAFALHQDERLPVAQKTLLLDQAGRTALAQVRQADRIGTDVVSQRFAVGGTGRGPPLIGQALAFGADQLILFIDDPTTGPSLGAEPSLQLLGLTPAEARIAAAIGSGRAPRQAAIELGLSPHTVRSALKIVFDKLSISRQSELARIVTRLEGALEPEPAAR